MNSIREHARRFRGALSRLSPLLHVRRRSIVAIALMSTCAGLAEAVLLALIAYVAATMSATADGEPLTFGPLELDATIPSILAVAATLAIVRLVLQIALARLPARLSGTVQSHLRTELMDSFLASTWAERSKEREGRLQELMGGHASHAGGAVLMFAVGLTAALEFLMLMGAALILSVGVSVAVVAIAVALFAALRPLSRRLRRRSAETSAAFLEQAEGVAEAVRLTEELEVFGVEEAERSRVWELVESLESRFVRTRSLARIVPIVYQSAVIFLLIAGLSVLYAVGTARLASLGAVILLLVRASGYGQQLQVAYQGFGEAVPYFDRIAGAIERYRAEARSIGEHPIGSIRCVEFDNVSFEYRPDTPVLRSISFSIRSGDAIGVVGPSGAGKSTLLQLLLGLRQPSKGTYLVNGVPASDAEGSAWHRQVSFLPQEPHVLAGSVAENIRFHREWVDGDAIERAARQAHIHDEILSWPDGYETVIGQRADSVSGGQRQRLCLARALAGRPEMLLLDEPTSSLDLRSERSIQDSLEELRGTVTLIVVAHRLTTLSLCGRVMVICDGRLEAFDSAELLYASNDFYRQAVDLATTRGSFLPA